MPNNTTNVLTITGPADKIAEFKALMFGKDKDGDTTFDFNRLVQRPVEFDEIISGGCEIDGKQVRLWREIDGKKSAVTEQEQEELTKKYGASNWYDWCIQNWGTKWNAYDFYMKEDKPKRLKFHFVTAWSPPLPIYAAIEERFPELKFVAKWADEGERRFETVYETNAA